jgi:hemerythrin
MRRSWLEWTDKLSVGIGFLDREHQELVGRYQAMVAGLVASGGNPRTLHLQIQRFLTFAKIHFSHEEALMRKIQYPGYVAHKRLHDKLLADASDFMQNLDEVYSKDDTSAVAEYFRHWLVNHITKHDVEISGHLEQSIWHEQRDSR